MIKPLAWLLVALLALLPGLANSAQVNDDQTTIQQVRILRSSNLAVAVPQAGSTTLLNLATRGEIKRIFVQFAVTSQALGGFVIQIVTPGGSAQTIATASGDYTSPAGP